MELICRLCLNNFQDDPNRSECNNKETQINNVLPEVDIRLTATVNLCSLCTKSLNDAYMFKSQCIRIERVLKGYSEKHPDKIPLDLTNAIDKIHLIASNKEINKNKNNEFERDIGNITCAKCQGIFEDENTYRGHMKDCLLYKCDGCNKIFSSEIELTNHKRIHIDVKLYLCELCSKTFKHRSSLNNHISSHNNNSNNTSFICPLCEKNFSSQRLLDAHSKIHTDRERRYVCKICNRAFYILQRLRRHEACHIEERKFKCTICEKSYKIPSYLQRHIVSSHEGIRKHICDICGVKFLTKSILTEHIRTHTGERPFKCEICGKGFTQNSTLSVHVKSIHSREKPFACKMCGKTFALKGNLKAHMAVHDTNIEKKYACTYCDKRFRINNHLQKHINRHRGVKKHICTICGKGFIGSTALKVHLRSHTGERPFECNICRKTFTQSGNLRIHLKSHKVE